MHDYVRRTALMIIDNHVRELSSLNEVYDGTGGVSEEEFRHQGHMIESGRIEKVKKTGDAYVVTFKTEKWEEPDYECKNTGRILGWDHDGKPQYDWKCDVKGWHTESFQLEPRAFSERAGGAELKAGMIVKLLSADVNGAAKGAPRPAFLIEIDEPGKGKKGPKPVAYLGVKLAAK
jgi:hypothetical protein